MGDSFDLIFKGCLMGGEQKVAFTPVTLSDQNVWGYCLMTIV